MTTETIERAVAHAESVFGPIPHHFVWERGRMAAYGTAHRSGRIRLSAVRYHEVEEKSGERLALIHLYDVVLHELGHLYTFRKYPRAKGHGREWKWVARRLGCAPLARRCPEVTDPDAPTCNDFRIGEAVSWSRRDELMSGKIWKKGPARAYVQLDNGERWTVRYQMLDTGPTVSIQGVLASREEIEADLDDFLFD